MRVLCLTLYKMNSQLSFLRDFRVFDEPINQPKNLSSEMANFTNIMLFSSLCSFIDEVNGTNDFFSTFVPCIAQLIPDNEIRKILFKNDSLLVLQQICWNVLNQEESSQKLHQLLECLVHSFHEVIILSPSHCKQTTWKPDLIKKLIGMYHQCCENRGLLTLYSRFELAAVLLRLSQLCGLEDSLFDEFLPSVTRFLLSSVKDLEDMDERYTDMWFVAFQSLLEVVSTDELQRKKLKADESARRAVSCAKADVFSHSVQALIKDFQRITYA